MTQINKAEGDMINYDNRKMQEIRERKEKEKLAKAETLMMNTFHVFRGIIEKNDASNNNKPKINDQLGVDISFTHLKLTADTIKFMVEKMTDEKVKEIMTELLGHYENALETFSKSSNPYFQGLTLPEYSKSKQQ